MTDDKKLSELSDHDLAEFFINEIDRRGLLGCVYLFLEAGRTGVFAACSPDGALKTLKGLTASEYLAVFSSYAALAAHEATLPDDGPKKWLN